MTASSASLLGKVTFPDSNIYFISKGKEARFPWPYTVSRMFSCRKLENWLWLAGWWLRESRRLSMVFCCVRGNPTCCERKANVQTEEDGLKAVHWRESCEGATDYQLGDWGGRWCLEDNRVKESERDWGTVNIDPQSRQSESWENSLGPEVFVMRERRAVGLSALGPPAAPAHTGVVVFSIAEIYCHSHTCTAKPIGLRRESRGNSPTLCIHSVKCLKTSAFTFDH